MITKTENLSKEVLDEIAELQIKSNQLMGVLGEIHLRKREMNKEFVKLDEATEKVVSDFDSTNARFGEIIQQLRVLYPNGDIDLQNGTVAFETEE